MIEQISTNQFLAQHHNINPENVAEFVICINNASVIEVEELFARIDPSRIAEREVAYILWHANPGIMQVLLAKLPLEIMALYNFNGVLSNPNIDSARQVIVHPSMAVGLSKLSVSESLWVLEDLMMLNTRLHNVMAEIVLLLLARLPLKMDDIPGYILAKIIAILDINQLKQFLARPDLDLSLLDSNDVGDIFNHAEPESIPILLEKLPLRFMDASTIVRGLNNPNLSAAKQFVKSAEHDLAQRDGGCVGYILANVSEEIIPLLLNTLTLNGMNGENIARALSNVNIIAANRLLEHFQNDLNLLNGTNIAQILNIRNENPPPFKMHRIGSLDENRSLSLQFIDQFLKLVSHDQIIETFNTIKQHLIPFLLPFLDELDSTQLERIDKKHLPCSQLTSPNKPAWLSSILAADEEFSKKVPARCGGIPEKIELLFLTNPANPRDPFAGNKAKLLDTIKHNMELLPNKKFTLWVNVPLSDENSKKLSDMGAAIESFQSLNHGKFADLTNKVSTLSLDMNFGSIIDVAKLLILWHNGDINGGGSFVDLNLYVTGDLSPNAKNSQFAWDGHFSTVSASPQSPVIEKALDIIVEGLAINPEKWKDSSLAGYNAVIRAAVEYFVDIHLEGLIGIDGHGARDTAGSWMKGA